MKNSTDLNAESATATDVQIPQPQDPYAALVLPENSLLTAGSVAALKEQAASLHLPASLLQTWLEQEEIRLEQQAQQQASAKREQQQNWAQQTRAMLGEKWQEEVSHAVRAADRLGGPQLRQLLEETGLGNHPAMVRAFAQVGKRMAEDVFVNGAAETSQDKTFTQALYEKQ